MRMDTIIIILLLLLLNLINPGACGNEVLVLKNNEENDCPNPILGVPIRPHLPLKEFTFCENFSLRFLRTTMLMGLGDNIGFKLYDFEDRIGFVIYEGAYNLFDFQSQNLEPDEWQHICFAVSMNQIKIALNGEILFNDEVVNLITNEIKNTTLWIGELDNQKFMMQIIKLDYREL